jgi:predicted TIM-barrel enzyme/AraC-like DNA-binding protein
MKREKILKRLRAEIRVNGHLVGATAGTGMSAIYTAKGGADFLLALNAGRMRQKGHGSLASYFGYANNNEDVMAIGTREILPLGLDKPLIFGLFASDPTIDLYDYIVKIRDNGFSGITNFPTLSLIDGQFREALEENGDSYDLEVEAVRIAHELDLFTVAYVTDTAEAKKMIDAGADVICAQLGLTKGGFLGADKYINLNDAYRICDEIFGFCLKEAPDVIRMVFSGPANSTVDMLYLYQNTPCQGYVGGSVFDRIPVEQAILNSTRAFKDYGNPEYDVVLHKIMSGQSHSEDYADFVKEYISTNYMKPIQLRDLALVAHVSPSYLSTRFKKSVGCSFTEYLIRFRMGKAREIIESNSTLSFSQIAGSVGYDDYVQFSKMFKKYTGSNPSEYKSRILS